MGELLNHLFGILTGAGDKPASALQQAEILSVAAGVRGALRFAPSDVSEDDKKMVEQFVHDPMKFYSHPKGSLAQVKNPFGDYAPASGAIQGMLKGMYDSMTSDLESKNV